jgi:hypothetical protein
VIGQADLIFGIELNDYYGAVHGFSVSSPLASATH